MVMVYGETFLRISSFMQKPWRSYTILRYRYLSDEIPRRGGIDEGENDLPGGE